MIDGMYISAAGAHIQQVRHDVISNNVANVDTVGFKRQMALLEARPAEALIRGMRTGKWTAGGGLFIERSLTDFAQGPLEQTDNPLNCAITGEGFFSVTDGANTFYTRAGNFAIDSEGYLSTPDGKYRVTDANGSAIYVEGGTVEIDRAGNVVVSNGNESSQRGTIALTAFEEIAEGSPEMAKYVEHVGENLYKYNGERSRPAGGGILQGSLEQSSVSNVEEMVNMIQCFRIYEANMMALRSQDTTLQQAVSKVGRINA